MNKHRKNQMVWPTILGITGLSLLLVGLGCSKSSGVDEPPQTNSPAVAERTAPEAVPVSAVAIAVEPQAQPVAPTADTGFRFSDDAAGKLLSKLLAPSPRVGREVVTRTAALERSGSTATSPDVLFSWTVLSVPRLSSSPTTLVRPTALTDRIPIELARTVPALPGQGLLPEGSLTKVGSRDSRQPVELPILARPTPDRASLEDPTTDFTASSVIAVRLPLRETTAPFVKVNLPEPFENTEAAKPRTTLPDDPLKVLGSPAPPKPTFPEKR